MEFVETWGQFGLAGLVAGAAFLLVGRLLEKVTDRNNGKAGGGARTLAVVPCPFDQSEKEAWHKLQEDAHQAAVTVQSWNAKVLAGGFDCAWRGRDEVLQLARVLEKNQDTSAAVLKELHDLVRELRMERNGRSKP